MKLKAMLLRLCFFLGAGGGGVAGGGGGGGAKKKAMIGDHLIYVESTLC